MPFNTFAIFYVIVCHHLKQVFHYFHKYVKKNAFVVDFEGLRKSYNELLFLVESIDKDVSVYVFCATVFNSGIWYSFMASFLHANQGDGWYHRNYLNFFCFNSFLSFFVMSVSALMVNEAASQIAKKTRSMKATNIYSAMSLQRFQFCASKEVNLTVWKITPIKRNFFINIIGIIFTYALLLDSLNK